MFHNDAGPCKLIKKMPKLSNLPQYNHIYLKLNPQNAFLMGRNYGINDGMEGGCYQSQK